MAGITEKVRTLGDRLEELRQLMSMLEAQVLEARRLGCMDALVEAQMDGIKA